jgi:hypothetical protein
MTIAGRELPGGAIAAIYRRRRMKQEFLEEAPAVLDLIDDLRHLQRKTGKALDLKFDELDKPLPQRNTLEKWLIPQRKGPLGLTEITIKELSESRKQSETASTQRVHVPAGVTQEFTVTRQFSHSVTIEHTPSLESTVMGSAEFSTEVQGILSAAVRKAIQEKRGTKYAESETRTQTIQLVGGEEDRDYELFW